MSANIKKIEKLFGTHHAIKVAYDDESYKFALLPRLLSKALCSIHPSSRSAPFTPAYLALAANEIII